MMNGYGSDPKTVELEAHISREVGGLCSHLHVSVKDNVVTLTGTTEDFENKRRIETRVKGLAGTHRVVNQIRVISTSESFDNYR